MGGKEAFAPETGFSHNAGAGETHLDFFDLDATQEAATGECIAYLDKHMKN